MKIDETKLCLSLLNHAFEESFIPKTVLLVSMRNYNINFPLEKF